MLEIAGLSLSRPPPREDAKAFISHAFPRAELGPTVLVEAWSVAPGLVWMRVRFGIIWPLRLTLW